MALIHTPFGDYDPDKKSGSVVDVVVPPPPPPIVYPTLNPLLSYFQDSMEPEVLRVRRVTVCYDRIGLALPGWQTRDKLTPDEQAELYQAFRYVRSLDLPWFSSAWTDAHAHQVKLHVPQLDVYGISGEVE